jgi:LiaF transmembrane domain/Cell wall-active antibiotics response LiaF, C-terminal
MRTDKAAAQIRLRLGFGLVVMLLGLLLTLDNFGVLEARQWIRIWPVLLIGLALAKLFHASSPAARPAGYFLLLLGLGLLLGNLGVLEFRQVLALLLLAVGTAIAWRAARSPREPAPPVVDPIKHLDVFALLGYIQRALSAKDFRGGSATAVMGGCEIDLGKASIEGGEAVINTFALWGGIEIRVPADWMVETRGTALLGAFEDTSRRPDDDGKKLIVTGIAVMGGVEVKN